MKKVLGVMAAVACTAVLVWATEPAKAPAKSDTAKTVTADTAKADSVKTFDAAALAKFDGKEGRAAYVAVDGVVYDVTKAKGWKNGEHKGFKAGKDVTSDMKKQSPHGTGPVTKNPVVGKYVVAAPSAPAAAPTVAPVK